MGAVRYIVLSSSSSDKRILRAGGTLTDTLLFVRPDGIHSNGLRPSTYFDTINFRYD